MSNSYTVIGQENCTYCKMAVDLLKSKDKDFMYLSIGKDITKDDFFKIYPNARSVPQISYGTEHIGGFAELKAHLNANI